MTDPASASAFTIQPLDLDGLDIVRMLAISLLIAALVPILFARSAGSRRAFIGSGFVVMAALPVLLGVGSWQIPVGMPDPWQPLDLGYALPPLLGVAWCVGAVIAWCRLGMRYRDQARCLAELPVIDPVAENCERARIGELLRDTRRLAGLGAPVQLRAGREPCAGTFSANTIVLPREWRLLHTDHLRAVLAHEIVHVQRHDDRWLAGARCVAALYWWMPWLRWLVDRFEAAIEESCDDQAAALLERDVQYWSAVLAVVQIARARAARTEQLRDNPDLSDLPGAHGSHLERRIARFLLPRVLGADRIAANRVLVGVTLTVLVATGVKPVAIAPPTDGGRQLIAPMASSSKAAQERNSSGESLIPRVRWTQTPHTDRLGMRPSGREAPPIYPGAALRAAVEADVEVYFSVAADGSVSRVRVLNPERHPEFTHAVVRSLERVHFERVRDAPGWSARAALRATGPPSVPVLRRYRFRLESDI